MSPNLIIFRCVLDVGGVVDPREDPLLVMEFMLHGSLYDILHSEFMDLEGPMLLNMLGDIAQGMRFLHACEPQVIHRDLKSSNILVDSRFRAKISDFGLPLSQHSGAIGMCFTSAFASNQFFSSSLHSMSLMMLPSVLSCRNSILDGP